MQYKQISSIEIPSQLNKQCALNFLSPKAKLSIKTYCIAFTVTICGICSRPNIPCVGTNAVIQRFVFIFDILIPIFPPSIVCMKWTTRKFQTHRPAWEDHTFKSKKTTYFNSLIKGFLSRNLRIFLFKHPEVFI